MTEKIRRPSRAERRNAAREEGRLGDWRKRDRLKKGGTIQVLDRLERSDRERFLAQGSGPFPDGRGRP